MPYRERQEFFAWIIYIGLVLISLVGRSCDSTKSHGNDTAIIGIK